MKAIATIGAGYSPRAYCNEKGEAVTELPPAALAVHEFLALPDGRLLHRIDGRDRAIVPPEGFAQYAELWPDCRPVLSSLRGGSRSPSDRAPAKRAGRRAR